MRLVAEGLLRRLLALFCPVGTSERGNHGSIVANKPPVKRAASINSTDEFDPRGKGRLTYGRRRNGGEVISSSSKRMCVLIILELISSII